MAKRFLPVSYADTADIHVPVYSYPCYFAKKVIFVKIIFNTIQRIFLICDQMFLTSIFSSYQLTWMMILSFIRYLWNKNIRWEIRSKPKLYAHAQKSLKYFSIFLNNRFLSSACQDLRFFVCHRFDNKMRLKVCNL